MASYVKSIEATSIYGRYDFQLSFSPQVNIVYGKNGTGKTTLLHILANILNGEYYRFAFLPFNSVTVELSDNVVITLRNTIDDNQAHLIVEINDNLVAKLPVAVTRDLLRSERRFRRDVSLRERRLMAQEEIPEPQLVLREFMRREGTEAPEQITPPLPVAYFPAFRTMIDAWASVPEESERLRPQAWSSRATDLARRWFGQFVPSVNYPSLLEIEQRLTDEVQHARLTIGRTDRELLSQGFLQIFESLSRRPEQSTDRAEVILQEIRSLFDRLEKSPLQEESPLVTEVYAKLPKSIHDLDLADESERTAVRVLNVYRELLRQVVTVQESSFREIQQYLESVNEFLEGKRLIVDPTISRYHRRSVGIRFDDGTSTSQLRALSSGERQIVTLIYAATHMSEQKALLIDEPEISLHVDWQRRLIAKMSAQIGNRQVIACTHSPVIGADYDDLQKEIELLPTAQPLVTSESTATDEQEILL